MAKRRRRRVWEDKPAAQVLREFMREYVSAHGVEREQGVEADRSAVVPRPGLKRHELREKD